MAFVEMFLCLLLLPGIVAAISKTTAAGRFAWYIGTVILTFFSDAVGSVASVGGGIIGILLVGGGMIVVAASTGARCPKCRKRIDSGARICAYCSSPIKSEDIGDAARGSRDLMEDKKSVRTKECPFCAETILAKARKCKHCGEILELDAQ